MIRTLGRRTGAGLAGTTRSLGRAVLVAGAALSVMLAARGGGAFAEPSSSQPALSGAWHTWANGDDVLALTREGTVVWAGSRHGGLVRWDASTGEYEQFLYPQDAIPGNTVRSIAIDSMGLKWLATDHGLAALDDHATATKTDDEWAVYTVEGTEGGLPTNDVWAVAPDGDTVWVGGAQTYVEESDEWVGGGLGRLDHAGTLDQEDDSWAPPVTFEATRSEPPTGRETLGLVSDSIRGLLVAPDGGLWVGAMPHWRFVTDGLDPGVWRQVHGGMSHVDPEGTWDTADDTWQAYSCETPLRDQDSRPVVACTMGPMSLDSAGNAWVAAGGLGAVAFRADQAVLGARSVTRFDDEAGLAGSPAEVVAPGQSASEVWIGLRQAGVVKLNYAATLGNKGDDTFVRYDQAAGLPGRRVQAIAADAQRMWLGAGPEIGIGGGVSGFDTALGAVIERMVTAAPLGAAPPSNFFTDVSAGAAGTAWEGDVWLGTGSRRQQRFGSGVARFSPADTSWDLFDAGSTDPTGKFGGLAGDNVHAVLVDGERVWFGSAETVWDDRRNMYKDGGLSVFEAGGWTARGAAGALTDGSVATLSRGCDGRLWIGFGAEWSFGLGADVLQTTEVHDPSADVWQHLAYPQLPSGNVRGIGHDCANGETWVAAVHDAQGGSWVGGGVSRRDGTGAWTRYDVTNGFTSYGDGVVTGEATSLLVAGSDVWAGGFGDLETTEQDLIQYAPYLPAPVNHFGSGVWSARVFAGLGTISDLAADPAGRIWASATREGLARDGEVPEDWVEDPQLPGILVLADGSWHQLGWDDGQPFSDVSGIAVAPDGDVWITSEGFGVARYSERVEPTPTPSATSATVEPSPTPPTGTPPSVTPPTATPTNTPGGTEPSPTSSPTASATNTGTERTPTPTRTGTTAVWTLYLPNLLSPLRP